MILLKDLFSLLAAGEFSNIALKKDDRFGELDESEYGKVIGHINLALVELYKRFSLREEEIDLHVRSSQEVYYLRSKYATIAGRLKAGQRYIEVPDDHDGYINLVEINKIFLPDGTELKLNNRFSVPSVRQTSEDTLKIIGLETETEVLSIAYKAHPSPIVLDDTFNINDYTLYVPKGLTEAILYYVAARVYKPIGANNSTANADKSVNYQAQYELACTKYELYGLDLQEDDEDPDQFERQGWA